MSGKLLKSKTNFKELKPSSTSLSLRDPAFSVEHFHSLSVSLCQHNNFRNLIIGKNSLNIYAECKCSNQNCWGQNVQILLQNQFICDSSYYIYYCVYYIYLQYVWVWSLSVLCVVNRFKFWVLSLTLDFFDFFN